ncbi:hypothetical protein CJF32_00006163 [Rutstroemia sp. NJR-2017a WRK4]|nr:hypothetical protein CJF32_00006163 [Rutstroemia sp. NJR-2017a WRK4]
MPALRHSVSQVFAPHPAFALRQTSPSEPQVQFNETAAKRGTFTTYQQFNNDEMISSLQPKRPSAPSPSTIAPPPIPTPVYQPPRTQIEALPPSSTPKPASYGLLPLYTKAGTLVLDPATRHPVFFTPRLRKTPEGVRAHEFGEERTRSPVARGYVYENGGIEERELKL